MNMHQCFDIDWLCCPVIISFFDFMTTKILPRGQKLMIRLYRLLWLRKLIPMMRNFNISTQKFLLQNNICKKIKYKKKEVKKIFNEAATHLEQFRIEFTHQTRESLMGHAKAIIHYYKTLFHKRVEYWYRKRRMYSAAIFLNPQILKGKPEAEIVTVIHYEADKLMHFNCHCFTL